MILSLVRKHKKTVAGFMLTVFSAQLILPAVASANEPSFHSPRFYLRATKGETQSEMNSFLFSDRKEAASKQIGTHSIQNIADQKKQPEQVNIGGPGQPEMSSFQSVNSNNMVDLFTGDFSYNIPLMDVGGYPLNIHYTGGITMDQEASWVGLGWNINPGTITRNMRGLPDDFNGTDSITKTQNIKQNKTVGVKIGGQAELAGLPLTVGAGVGVFHNNYNGWGIETSLNAAISLGRKNENDLNGEDDAYAKGPVKIGASFNNNSQTGLSINPSLNVTLKKYDKEQLSSVTNFGISTGYHTRGGLSSLTIDATKQKYQPSLFKPNPMSGISDVNISFAQPSVTPFISMPTTSSNFTFHGKVGGELFGLHGNVFIEGYVNKQLIKPQDQTQKLPAYGFLYYTDANNNPKALLDFNREKELQFNYQATPHIAIPQYTYDVYTISGEGTGGIIRPYRGDVGMIKDHYMRTRSESNQFSLEVGAGNVFHGGFSYDFVNAYSENNGWNSQNLIAKNIAFQKTDGLYQSVYFRNPGEKTSNTAAYYKQIGDDELIRVQLNRNNLSSVYATSNFVRFSNGKNTGILPAGNVIKKQDRDKREQVITYLKASEAATYGFEKNIYSYKENSIPLAPCKDNIIDTIQRVDRDVHKGNHISEIDVLNPDGRRYVYGIPAYNIEQKDLTFSVDKENSLANLDSGFVKYQVGSDNSTSNEKGKENYFNQERVPAYAHSFLLTAIVSPDYVDVKEDGITDDDLGDAVKFNYTRVYGPKENYFDWRTPGTYGKATYNEGLKTYSRDDKATYLYGRKEVWYTHSIESKTMIAVFKISADRKDAYAAAGENGGINTAKPLRKLDRIELYSKADLLKNGSAARPVKTVNFDYSYELCKNAEHQGKLTLKRIWFSYNGNNKGMQNPYVFSYSNLNPEYQPKKYDRWGNFKEASSNPGGLNNADYPYAVQDSAIAAQNAGAWHLTDIKLPSGGRMKITYESDDYAFVQNKRATQMFTVAGFGASPSSTPVNTLYDKKGDVENEYVFVNSSLPVTDANDIFRKYLEGNEWIYLKLAVNMPTDRWGSGFDFVPLYGKIKSYGKVSGANRFWIKFEKVDGISPMIRNTFQFLKNNLTSKAYPTSELGDNVDFADAVKMLGSSIGEIKNAVLGFEKSAMTKGWCKEAVLSNSLIRLNSAEYKKLGGGHRVKRIEIFDNWDAMTKGKLRESVYGQEYEYKTSIDVGGKTQVISSGVATYEPMIGGEENPFRQPIDYAEKLAPLAPVSYLYSEMPLGESYFSGASVGYSKVRVRTINAKAKSANGWEETEFFTSKDFPTLVDYTLLDQDAKARYNPKLQNLLKIHSVQRVTVSQGFKIELNDMNGKVKRTASYAENDSLNPVAYTQNFYKVDDDRSVVQKLNNTVWVVDSANGKINKNGIIGKDIELVTDFRQQYSSSISGGVSPNLDYFQIGIFPVPIPSFFKFPQFDESQFRSAATVKIIQRYGILDSVIVKDKSSIVSTKNLLYDGETGEVVLSRTKNEFNDPVYNFGYPAHWAYSGMGMAYKNVQAEFSNLLLINGKLFSSANQPFPIEKYFESGDELWITGTSASPDFGESCESLLPNPFTIKIDGKAYVVDASKGASKDAGLYIIDKQGRPFSGRITSLKVLRSGKRNMLDASVGSILSLGNPITETSPGTYRLVLDSSIRVINASAVSYKDFWKVEQSLYEKDTVVQVTRSYGPVLFSPTVTTMRLAFQGSNRILQDDHISNSDFVACSYDYAPGAFCRSSLTAFTKSLLRFNFTQIPSNANIVSAYIQFAPKLPTALWWRIRNEGSFTCKDNFSYDWNTATNYFLGNSAASLKRITGNWNDDFKYNFITTTSVNQASVTATNYNSVDCRNLVQDLIRNSNYGLALEINDVNRDNDKRSETNYLSFCGSNNTATGLPCNNTLISTQARTSSELAAAAVPYCSCLKPQLYVTWSVTVDTVVKVCRNNITDTTNPYRWGILGNWRMDRAYTYYSDRKESDASVIQTDIRKEGTLKSFTTYWKFSDALLAASPDTTRWVWNSATSAYNRKGFEIENYDALDRYSSGLYGYNQTLPVAVAQNAKYREILSDGFEDYDYKTKDCISCEAPKEVDFRKGQSNVSVSDEEAHTGRYSLKVNASAESRLSIPLTNQAPESQTKWYLNVDSTPVYALNVVGKGQGLSATYTGAQLIGNRCNPARTSTLYVVNPNIDFNWGNVSPYPNTFCLRNTINRYDYDVNWSGFLQAKVSGYYRFYFEKTAGPASLRIIKGTTVLIQNTTTGASFTTVQAYLQAGELYNIVAAFSKAYRVPATVRLSWQVDNGPWEVVPQQFLYRQNMTSYDTVGSIQRKVKLYCIAVKNDSLRSAIRPAFSPTQGAKMVMSAWVKMAGADCSTAPALNDVIIASFNNNSSVSLQKTGVRIEGWQRYESVVDVPLTANTLYVSLRGVQGRTVYVDDTRMQPYNSAMKTYVYDPVSLRLMADLDENNYASFYEYDDDGTLIRVKKETEKGILTVKETRSALLKD